MRSNLAVLHGFKGFWSSVRVVTFGKKVHPATKEKIGRLWLSATA